MKFVSRIFLLTLCIAFITPSSQAQLLDRMLRKTKQKVGNKVEDMVAEKVSEYIAQRVYKSMSDGFDRMMADAYKQDSSYRANYGDSVAIKYGGLASDWMARMNEAADVPDSYHFDYTVTAVSTYKRDKDEMTMYFPAEGGYFAMEQLENGQRKVFLLDAERDVTILYSEEGKKKSAQAIPNMMGLAGAMANTAIEDQETVDWEVQEIRGKTILGYKCDGFQASSEEGVSETYISKDVPIDWQEAFINSMKKFVVALNGSDEEFKVDGFVLESSYKSSKKSRDDHTWTVTAFDEDQFDIINAEYEFGGLGTE